MAGPGVRQLVIAPQRQAPLISLLTAAEIVADGPKPVDPTDPNSPMDPVDDRWLNGITYRREPCGVASTTPVGCITSTHGEESPAENSNADRSQISTDPFLVWTDEKCSTFGFGENEYVDRAKRLLAASEAYAVEKEFWTGTQAKVGIAAGVDYPTNQWLAQQVTSTPLNGGTAVSPGRALGLLQQALGDCAGGSPGLIHTAPPVANAWLTSMAITPVLGEPARRLIDIRDNRIVPGFGYSSNTGPDGSTPAADHYWAYATSMVYIRRSPVVVTPDRYDQAVNKTTNDIEFRAQRYYSVDWDRCCHFAILINNCDVCP